MIPTIPSMVLILSGAATALAGSQQGAPTRAAAAAPTALAAPASAVAPASPASAVGPASPASAVAPASPASAVAPASPSSAVAPASPSSAVAPAAPEATAPAKAPAATETAAATACLRSGDGYFRARVAGAIEATVDWPNSGTRCEGESRDKPPGVRLSFQRASGGATDLLFVFGITGVREGRPLREAGANLTVIVQGTDRIFGTLGDSRCTVDSLTQRALEAPGS